MGHKEIITTVEDYFHLDEGVCYIKRRKRPIVKARNTAVYFLIMNGCNKSQLAGIFNMHRSTFYNSIPSVEGDIFTNRVYRQQIAELKKIIFGDNMEYLLNQETKQMLNHKWEAR